MTPTRVFILGLTLLCASFQAMAQQTITGKVLDETGEGIPGVTVLEKGTTNGTITDFNGDFSITVTNSASILQFTSIGFASIEEVVGERTSIDIGMNESQTELDEVVVIGYGTQRKKVVTGAIESVSADEINSQPLARVDQALQGRAAGVQVVNQSGQPGEGPVIRIRGIGTDGNPEPLILVDGMAVNSIDNINPGDVESMEVLKDSAATSIYGARAANGVILITTKSGSEKFSVTYNGYKGVQNVARKVDLLNSDQYVELMASAGARSLTGQDFDVNEVPANYTDWQSALFTKNAPIEYHEINLQGGTENSAYTSSISYFNQEGIIGGERSKIEKYIGKVKGRTQVNDMFAMGSDITYTNLVTRGVASNSSFNGEYNSALNLDPLTPVYETDEFLLSQAPYSTNPVLTTGSGDVFGISQYVGQEVVNPLAKLRTQNQVVTKDQILANVYGELEPVENLIIRSSASMDLSYLEFTGFNDIYYLSSTNATTSTSAYKVYLKNTALQFENTARYSKKISDHRFDLMIGNTYLTRNSEDLSGSGQGLDVANPNLRYLNLVV
ncbi:MAG: SusC/RagA family TonB-linked outer membrane protein, partial [Cyclobacteriaceae bacterium]